MAVVASTTSVPVMTLKQVDSDLSPGDPPLELPEDNGLDLEPPAGFVLAVKSTLFRNLRKLCGTLLVSEFPRYIPRFSKPVVFMSDSSQLLYVIEEFFVLGPPETPRIWTAPKNDSGCSGEVPVLKGSDRLLRHDGS